MSVTIACRDHTPSPSSQRQSAWRRAAAAAQSHRRAAAADRGAAAPATANGGALAEQSDALSDAGSDSEADPGEIYLRLAQVGRGPLRLCHRITVNNNH